MERERTRETSKLEELLRKGSIGPELKNFAKQQLGKFKKPKKSKK